MPYFKCLSEKVTTYALKKVHKGVYENNLGEKVIAYKFLKRGYYW